ncbi:MAG: site-specific DNA-methyltransferase [Bacteroidales bacterium]|jgi:site-specific DNA-methyltransferase (cytosine-N4-specific)|nr:site-specific DNA-methyltransferase [Bacteroidales bacterium]
MDKVHLAYKTNYGKCFHGNIEDILRSKFFQNNKGKINLIFTSPPFPLNRKKKYGNLNGNEYIEWLTNITTSLKDYLTDDGSFVIEIGNSWEEHEPIMSTLSMETLLAIKNKGEFKLCQQFIWFNTAKLPSPVQWVNVDRIRVKDSFTTIWWMSKTAFPKANNKNVLEEYSESMKKLLKTKKYNSGLRPSEHHIGKTAFLKDNGGAIPSNVLIAANTVSTSNYLKRCKETGIIPHPARMPNFIAEFFVKFLTDEGDIVLDPFCGSNTTGEICESLKRIWLSVEINENYIIGSKLKFKNE